jgi:hypothetical protein
VAQGGKRAMTSEHARGRGVGCAQCAETSRIEFLLQRDGAAATVIWVRRTLAIYRRALLDRRHFAHTAAYRRKFVASYLELRHWLVANGAYGNRGTALPQPDTHTR